MSTGSLSKLAHQALGLVFALALISGLYLFAGNLFSPGYFPVLSAHIALGVAVAIGLPLGLALHLKQTSSPGLGSMFPVLLLLSIPLTLVMLSLASSPLSADEVGLRSGLFDRMLGELSLWLWGTDTKDGKVVGLAAVAAALLAVVSGALAGVLRARDPSVPVRWSGVLASAVVMLALTTGLFGWLVRGDGRFEAYAAHSLFGVLALVATIAHFRGPRRVLGLKWGFAVLLAATVATSLLWALLYGVEHPRSGVLLGSGVKTQLVDLSAEGED
ncbi:MAG: hypothetical protein VX498_01180, partial [Myxococcota bacterium]|nr:hypothetical protein [Myxococcota bacterium]